MKKNSVDKKITKVGNSYAVILPKEFINLLNVDLGDIVQVEYSEATKQILISNKDNTVTEDPFEERVLRIIEKYMENKNSGKE